MLALWARAAESPRASMQLVREDRRACRGCGLRIAIAQIHFVLHNPKKDNGFRQGFLKKAAVGQVALQAIGLCFLGKLPSLRIGVP